VPVDCVIPDCPTHAGHTAQHKTPTNQPVTLTLALTLAVKELCFSM